MNDRFKFRAWHNKRKVMVKIANLIWFWKFNSDGSTTNDGISAASGELHEQFETEIIGCADAVIMQCTGLKDKNGKLIYEGDVLRWCWEPMDELNASEFYKETGSRFSRIYNVKFNGSGFNLPRDAVMNAEIIGNVYENPELLES